MERILSVPFRFRQVITSTPKRIGKRSRHLLKRKIPYLIVLLFWAVNSFAQTNKKNIISPTPVKNKGKIEVLQASRALYDTSFAMAHRLVGNVVFKHDEMLMFCDSAWFYEKKGRIKAFGHVHVQQGDTLNVYGDSLNYTASTKIARLKGHVRVIEKDLVMVTDSVTYDARKAMGYYQNGATITSAKNKNTLTSRSGYYHSKSKNLYFRGNVVLKNPESVLTTDTLRYNISKETAYFVAPTLIQMNDTSEIVTSNGWYDTRKDLTAFFDRSILRKKEKHITADTIYYDKNKAAGTLLGHAWMYDTTQQTGLFGHYVFYDEKKEEVLLTKEPYMVKAMKKDTFYLKADTIQSYREKRDSSEFATVKAFHHVRFMKGNMVGKADSLHYSETDSLIKFFSQPVLWSDKQQLTGDYMQARVIDNTIHDIFIKANSFIISQADTTDSTSYNQIKGRNIYAYLRNDEIHKIKVEGNGQTLYYMIEEGKKASGINRMDCSDIVLKMVNGEIDRVTFIYQPDATLYPIKQYPANEKYLKDFKWLGKEKPDVKEFGTILGFVEKYGLLPK